MTQMNTARIRPRNRIIVLIMLPVVLFGLAAAIGANRLLADPLVDYLKSRADQRLRLSSGLALAICDELMQNLLALRLEDDPAAAVSTQKEALEQIKALHQKLVNVHLAVTDENGRVLASTLPLPERLPGFSRLDLNNGIRTQELDGSPIRFHSRYFPFWRWHVISLSTAEAYLAPAAMASRAVYLGVFGVLAVLLVTVLIVFHLLVNRPLSQMIQATRGVALGEFPRLEIKRQDELGQLAIAFNAMVASLERGQEGMEKVLDRLKQSEEAYRSLAENSLALIAILRDGILLYVNDRALALSGYAREELVGQPLDRLIHPDDRGMLMRRTRERQVDDWRINQYELRYVCKDGRVRWLELLASPITYQGQPAVLGHAIDITERKNAQQEQRQLEAKLNHAQRMEVVGTLAGGISHDFNNLLHAITGYAQITLNRLGEDSPLAPHLRGILRSAGRGGELVNQLLAFSRRAESRLKPVNINQEVLHVCQMLTHTIPRMVSIETRLARDIWPILADPTQLEQVMMNLGSNARDAMPQGGRLTFETMNVVLDETAGQRLVDLPPGEYVQLRVSDTGHGMDEHTRSHIFDPFFTTKPLGQGTGLGLSTVYGIVKAHHGHISCYSHPGQGATFNLYLPVAAEMPREQAANGAPPPPPRARGELVLLVDDEQALLEITREMLQELGYKVLVASSGEEALEVYAGQDGRVDLVLMDLGMPGMGGRLCLERLLEMDPGAKVVISTGYVDRGQEEEALGLGAAGFLAKPYQLGDLVAKIRQALGKA